MIGIEIGLKPKFGDVTRALKEELERRINAGFSSVLETAEACARKEAPYRSGRLRNSIRAHLDAPRIGSLIAATPYASFVHDGTGLYGPHGRKIIIRPKRRKTLSWPGARHPVRKVVQKGMKPMNLMLEALREILIKSAFDGGFSGKGNQ